MTFTTTAARIGTELERLRLSPNQDPDYGLRVREIVSGPQTLSIVRIENSSATGFYYGAQVLARLRELQPSDIGAGNCWGILSEFEITRGS
jgi:hypothetical protein